MRLSRVIAIVAKTAVVTAVASLVALGPAVGPAAAAAQGASSNGVTELDVALVKKINGANLVEMWAGKRAQQFGVSPAVKWVGKGLLNDHVFLTKKLDEASEALGVKLPKEPDLQQQSAVRKMARVTGKDFDLAFANSLHFGHTVVLKMAQDVVAENSENPVVRQLGSLGVSFVSKHIAWLEATGLVTAASSKAAATQAAQARVSSEVKPFSNTLPAMIGLGSLAALLLTVAYMVLRPKPAAAAPAPRGRGGGRSSPGGGERGRSRASSRAR